MSHLSGLIAATYTPMHGDGSLCVETIDRLAERLVRDEVGGVFACGTTGEFPLLTAEERRQVAGRWCAVAGESLKVIVHVGGNCLAECKALAAHAGASGATAIAAIGPYFFRPTTVEDLVDFCGEVAAAAPGLPFYYYHLPGLSGVRFPMTDFLEVAADRIPTLAGIKYSHADLMDLGRCVQWGGGRYNILFGCDEILLSGLVLGVPGAVGTTYGFAAPLYQGILEDFGLGDMEGARRKQARSMEMVDVFKRFRLHAAMKATMKMTGIDCGPVRPPMRPLSEEECAALEADLEAIGFREFCSREHSDSAGTTG